MGSSIEWRTRRQESLFPLRGAACVADADPAQRTELARALRYMGFNTHETSSAAAACFIASNIRLELLLINLLLPDANALQLIRQFRRAQPSLCIVAMAPRGRSCAPVCDELARFAGADAALAAPAASSAVCETVSQLLPHVGLRHAETVEAHAGI